MRLREFTVVATITGLAVLQGWQASTCAHERAANPAAAFAAADAPSASSNEAGSWGESELKFELAPTTSAATPIHPSTAKQSYPVKPASFNAPVAAKPLAPPTSTRSRSVVGIYSNPAAAATLSKIPRPAPIQQASFAAPTAQSTRGRSKPFESVESGPTVSPYLNLYRNDRNTNMMSNYYAFVRPQLDQIEANRKQAADMQRLQAQLQNAQANGGGAQPITYGNYDGRPAPVARFGDTAQFYQRTRR